MRLPNAFNAAAIQPVTDVLPQEPATAICGTPMRGARDGDLRDADAVQRLREGGGAMDDGAVWQGYQIHVVVFDGCGDDERVRLLGLRAGAVLRIEADALRTEAVVEMLFAVVVEAAVATRDGIALMDKQLRKAGDTDAADADAEDFGWRER